MVKVLRKKDNKDELERKIEMISKLWRSRIDSRFLDRYHHLPDLNYSQEEWEDAGEPHTWKIAEIEGEYTVIIDTSYWYMILFKNDEIIGSGEHEIISDNIVVLDKSYWEVFKYIWK